LIMPAPGEYKTVQARILTYAQDIGWTYVSCDEAERKLKTGQAGFCRTGKMRYTHRPGNQGENKGASDPR
jgi:hypothetical protein